MPRLGSGRSGRRDHPASLFLVVLMVAMVFLAAACSSPGPAAAGAPTGPVKAVITPDTSAGAQLRWLITADAHLPLSGAQVRAHFDAAFLAQISPAMLNQGLHAVVIVRLLSIEASEPSTLIAIVSTTATNSRAQVALTVDSQGLISELTIGPATAAPTPTTWDGVDAALRSVAPQVRLLVANVSNGSCQPIYSIDPAAAAPLGSAFKLYVLDALGNAVASGKVHWNQQLTVTAQLKSLPSGELQKEPDGTRISVQDTAAKMISISDNTAANMLINLVGQAAVEAALTTTGMADPALDRPFLTTRELFILKLDQWPALAKRYIAANEAGRRALLARTVDRAPLPTVSAAQAWTTPRDIDSVEWFASADDICRAYTSLAALARRPGLAPIGQILSLNDDGLQLDRAQWKTTWFKGGSEVGVLCLAYLATTQTGQSYVVTVLAENPSQPINDAKAAPVLLSAIKGAFTLAARRTQRSR
jgi:Beta-lactamase enzyme family/ORF 12 gene product N-terminal